MINKGFSLAEILLALVVLGFVSSITIPVLIENSRSREFKAGYHRAINVLNNAYSEYASARAFQYETKYKDVLKCENENTHLVTTPLLGIKLCVGISDSSIQIEPTVTHEPYLEKSNENLDPVNIGQDRLNSTDLIMNNLIKPHILIADSSLIDKTNSPIAGCDEDAEYFYTQDGMRYCIKYSASAAVNDKYADKTYGIIWVDVNGESKPNAVSSSSKNVGDTFPIVIMKDRFIPGHPSDATAAEIAQEIYFGKKQN